MYVLQLLHLYWNYLHQHQCYVNINKQNWCKAEPKETPFSSENPHSNSPHSIKKRKFNITNDPITKLLYIHTMFLNHAWQYFAVPNDALQKQISNGHSNINWQMHLQPIEWEEKKGYVLTLKTYLPGQNRVLIEYTVWPPPLLSK